MANGVRSNSNTASMTLLAVLIVIAVLYFARVILIPFALAVLLSFLLAPLVVRLGRWGWGRVPATLVVVHLAFSILAVIGALLASQLGDVGHKLPEYQQNIRKKMQSLRSSGGGFVSRITGEIRNFTEELNPPSNSALPAQPGNQKPVPVEIHQNSFSPVGAIQTVLGSVFNILLTCAIVIVFVIFMLIQREDLRDRLIRLVGAGRVNLTTQAMDDAAQRLSRYLLAQLLVNVLFGVLVGIGLFFVRVPNPVLWAIVAALFRYVPYLGIWIAAVLPAAIAFAVEVGWVKVPIIFGLYFGTDLLMYNFVEPLVYGNSTGISPMAILVSAVFWTWLWGGVGLLLATPLTVCVVVVARYVPNLAFLSVLLSDEPVLSPETRFYQRMLAMDLAEAREVAEEYLKGRSLEELYDGVIIPALSLSEEERHLGNLDSERQKFIFQNTRVLVEDLAQRADGLMARENGHKGLESDKANGEIVPSAPEEVSLVCIPARDEADELAALMLAQLLDKKGIRAKTFPCGVVPGELLHGVAQEKPPLACVFAIPPFGYLHVRGLCRRLHQQFPALRLIAAILTERDVQEIKKRQPTVPADEIVSSLRQAMNETIVLLRKTKGLREAA
jgi:predicted PurR-regulated permease PerM